MKIIHTINTFAVAMLLIALGGAAIALWTSNRSEFYNDRVALAHQSYQTHLQLTANTFQLFKHYGNARLTKLPTSTEEGAVLVAAIRQNISEIRAIIANEIKMVGEEEEEELELLAHVQLRVEALINRFEAVGEADNLIELAQNWNMLSNALNNGPEGRFRAMIDEALEEELEEVEETQAEAAAHTRFTNRLAYGFALLASLTTGIGLIIFRRQILGPLVLLISGVRVFASGRFDQPVQVSGGLEIAEIGRVLDDMAVRVQARTQALTNQNTELERAVNERTAELQRLLDEAQQAEANRRRLLADVSHELRTPLTIIQGEADIALRGKDKSPEEYRDALTRARDAAVHTGRLVSDLLFISRKESGQARLALEEVDLLPLLNDTVDMTGKTIEVISDMQTAPATVDPMRIRQGIIALLHNAINHGDGKIVVRLNRSPTGYSIKVEDNGPGINEADRERAFERFFRGSNAAISYSEGTGLGLPVVRSIAEAHGGTASLKEREGGGTVAVIDLPEHPK